jgi:hypothetical protein
MNKLLILRNLFGQNTYEKWTDKRNRTTVSINAYKLQGLLLKNVTLMRGLEISNLVEFLSATKHATIS